MCKQDTKRLESEAHILVGIFADFDQDIFPVIVVGVWLELRLECPTNQSAAEWKYRNPL